MPTYDYVCTHCEREFEVMQSMKDDPLTDCDVCGESALKRKIGAGVGVIFKGSGFYETDYKRPRSNGGEGASSDSGGGESGASGSGSGESSGGQSGAETASKKASASSGSSASTGDSGGSGGSD